MSVYYPCFRVQKSDTKATQKRGGTSMHFHEKYLVPFLLLHMSNFKSLCRFTMKMHQKLKKSFLIKKNNDKANYSQHLQQKTKGIQKVRPSVNYYTLLLKYFQSQSVISKIYSPVTFFQLFAIIIFDLRWSLNLYFCRSYCRSYSCFNHLTIVKFLIIYNFLKISSIYC